MVVFCMGRASARGPDGARMQIGGMGGDWWLQKGGLVVGVEAVME